MGKQTAPAPPDPYATAAAQSASNKETAIAQAGLNFVDQTDAQGNKITFAENGKWSDGTPKFAGTQTLGAAGQALQDTNNGTSQNLATLARDQSGRIGGLLSQPFDFSAQKDYLEGLTSGALDKSWGQDSATLATTLANKGIKEGSDAFKRAMSDFRTDKSAGYNAANVANYNTALQSQMALRNQPLNEILALAGQTGVAAPNFAATPQTGVAGTDIAGLVNNNYNAQVGAVNSANQSTGTALGGLFGAAGNLMKLSDERAKENIRKVGETDDGQPIYSYNYKGDPTPQMGLIAQEVQKDHPEAVRKIGGLLAVDYDRALEAA